MARIAPLNPPYATDIQTAFDAIMPAGVDPLVLFRTLAVNTRVYGRFHAGGLRPLSGRSLGLESAGNICRHTARTRSNGLCTIGAVTLLP